MSTTRTLAGCAVTLAAVMVVAVLAVIGLVTLFTHALAHLSGGAL